MEKYFIRRYESFKRCLEDLTQAKGRDYINDTFVLSGVISKFCLTFDLSWKVMKDIIREYYNIEDYAVGSPSENLKVAFSCGLIDEEDSKTWFTIMKLRNQLSHDYDASLAREVSDDIVNKYIDLFLKFQESIEEFIDKINKLP